MTILSLNPLVSPDPGLFIWSAVSFLVLLGVLRIMAWKPIVAALNEREQSIEGALLKAEAAKEEMSRLIGENEELLKHARAERDLILKEAKQVKDQIIGEAKDAAMKEGNKMIEKARVEIDNQKATAMAEVKDLVATLSIEIAEKVLRKQFEKADRQDELVADLLKQVKLN